MGAVSGIAVAPSDRHRTGRRPLRLLTFTTLFPNPGQPVNGIFVENRLRHLVESGEVEARVVAPVPWFPSSHPRWGEWSKFALAPPTETRHGLRIWHPRYPVIAKVGMSVAPLLLYTWTRAVVGRLLAQEDIDAIDAHYFYPDGVAAALLAREFKKPLVITGRGSDLNQIPQYVLPGRQIAWAARRANGIITVCEALTDPLRNLGVADDKIRVLRNGVDLVGFHPIDRVTARAALGLSGPTLLSVGLLIERKGHHLIIEAMAHLPDFTLLIAGGGPDRAQLEALAQRMGVAERVRFLGVVPHQSLATIYSAADALVLASSREGWANVLLESMACATPVVATNVWGTAEAVTAPEAGVLISERSAQGIVEGVRRLFAALPERAATRRHAERFSWDKTTQGQIELFRTITGQPF
ncbi:glycosyltransferase family 4 protein [Magnetospirillum molischianum]|uniref:Putative Glycosyl transferase, group 1 n=1 Tax=Magnetospirillum molischianum DSM 120 TaxID=1150626 RepID=H8FQC5_MAGML|nr:glycosyltransferase family 4 protein [Magnetospirillum molischianum]CCG40563.1 Putative Glycosyl transferase, group 1 [Magnetospirillum molischianum DSM 120]